MIGVQEYSPNMRGQVFPPGFVHIGAAGVVTVFDGTQLAQRNLQYLRIQNIGANTCHVCINDTADAAKFNAILAKDTAAGAGNGGVISIPGTWNVTKVTVYAPAATDITIILVCSLGNERIVN